MTLSSSDGAIASIDVSTGGKVIVEYSGSGNFYHSALNMGNVEFTGCLDTYDNAGD